MLQNSGEFSECNFFPAVFIRFKKIKHIKLLVPIFRNGKSVYKNPSILKIKELLSSELDKIDNSVKRLHNPHLYKVGLEKKLYNEKNDMILNLRKL